MNPVCPICRTPCVDAESNPPPTMQTKFLYTGEDWICSGCAALIVHSEMLRRNSVALAGLVDRMFSGENRDCGGQTTWRREE